MSVLERHRVSVTGPAGATPVLFAHGFGCDQAMWRFVAPAFEDRYRVVRFDLAGSGGSDLSQYDAEEYSTLGRYAEDVVEICRELRLEDVVFVGHSVAGMIGVLAHLADPGRFSRLVLVGPSARYIDDDGYVGGYSRADIAELLDLMDSNNLGWQQPLATMLMPGTELDAERSELDASFCRTRPDIARRFAAVTFLGDNRTDLVEVTVPTLVLQNRHDSIAPLPAGEFVRDAIPGATMQVIETSGHCAHLSAPAETIAAIDAFLPS
ncbi:alpha/beta fold hydrolase [Nocardioides plantarum]|uniref:Alpha/beta fold hydrolase n=1 Tax=Nocardioides plantarum TaxID=29299 RepID=A0ABV5KGT7_9ACTN|nr:alpha/beta hydrolase [Nocardioides plantarum]